jgi:hypothetical protein
MGEPQFNKEGTGFIVGVAYNQHYGYDFGDPLQIGTKQGVPVMSATLEKRTSTMINDFRKLAAHGVNAVTVKVFADGRTGIDFDPSNPGRALAVQESVKKGLDNLMTVAAANGLAVQVVLFDHLFVGDPKGLETKPHENAMKNPDNRELLLKKVIEPVLEHLKQGKYNNLLSVELINEPESTIEGMRGKKGHSIPKAQTQAFKEYMRTVRDLVHDTTRAGFAVGCLGVGYAKEWLDVIDPKRDTINVHFFENSYNRDPKYADLYGASSELMKLLNAGVPVAFGEYAANGYGKGALAFLKDAYAHGIKGGFAWAMYDALGHPGGEHFEHPGTAHFGELPWNDFKEFHKLSSPTTQRAPSPSVDRENRDATKIPAVDVTLATEKLERGKGKKAHQPPAKGRDDFGL